jgi:hypothetical protein
VLQSPLAVRRYWPVIYWLVFACLAVIAAQDPGRILRSQPLPPFPWISLFIIWALLAVETYPLYVFIYRAPIGNSLLRQLTKAALYSLALCLFFMAAVATEQTWLLYVPMGFAFASLVLFGGIALAIGAARLWRRSHASSAILVRCWSRAALPMRGRTTARSAAATSS